MAQIDRLEEAVDTSRELQNKRMATLLEYNEVLLTNLEQYKELFMLLEQRIVSLQDMLSNGNLDSTSLTVVQAEITDILQSLRNINETETPDFTESNSEQNDSITTN